jgi:predicted transcriptional regulator
MLFIGFSLTGLFHPCYTVVNMKYKRLISDLLQWGLSQREIADRIGLTQAAISRLHNGSRRPLALAYPVMVRLLELHRKLIRKSRRG